MKTTQDISIAQTLFHIEEDAFRMLETYLQAVKKRFQGFADGGEIIADIEARISEQLLAKSEPSRIVTKEYVEEIIKSMGMPEELGEEGVDEQSVEGSGTGTAEKRNGPRKFYRDPDDRVIAGVCSGIAAYFGTDPLWVRLGFLLSLFAGGAGFIAYALIWLLTPLAETTAEKLEMRGSLVTLESMRDAVREKLNEVPGKAYGITKVFRAITDSFLPLLGKLIGVFVGLGAMAAFFGLVFVTIVAGTGQITKYVDPDFLVLFQGPTYFGALAAGFFVIALPIMFCFMISRALVRRTSVSVGAGFVMLALWFAALVGMGVSGLAIHGRYERFVATSPSQQRISETVPVVNVRTLVVKNGLSVKLVSGAVAGLKVEGRAGDISRMQISEVDGVVTVSRKDVERDVCIFCGQWSTTIVLTAPNLQSVRLEGGSRITGVEEITAANLNLTLLGGSYANLAVKTDELQVSVLNGSRVTLRGKTRILGVEATQGSRVDASDVTSQTATVTASGGSRVSAGMAQALSIRATGGSVVSYGGEPVLSEETSGGSWIQQE